MPEPCEPAICCVCHRPLEGYRRGTLTCGGRCRVTLWRVRHGKPIGAKCYTPQTSVMPTAHEVLTLFEVADRLRISPLAAKKLVVSGALPAVTVGRGQVRIAKAAVDRLIASGNAPAPGLDPYNVEPLAH